LAKSGKGCPYAELAYKKKVYPGIIYLGIDRERKVIYHALFEILHEKIGTGQTSSDRLMKHLKSWRGGRSMGEQWDRTLGNGRRGSSRVAL